MHQTFVLYPLFTMVLLTFAAGLWLLRCRIRAVREGLPPTYFKQNRGAKIPDYLVQATQHYDNLHEMPILFYVVVLMAYVTQLADFPLTVLAWVYVGLRIAHTGIHLTHNKVRTRMTAFLASFLILLLMWGWLLARLLFN